MHIAVGLGSSLGDRRATLERAVHALHVTPGLRVEAVSRWYVSPPMRGGTARGRFLNGVVRLRSSLDPWALLARCRALEEAAGRRRARFWGDRTLDLDLLVAEGFSSVDPELVLPHPGVGVRPFVDLPLAEVWPVPRPRHALAGCWPVAALAWPRPPA